MKNPKTAGTKKKLKNIPYVLAEKAFWIFIILFSASAFLIFSLVYKPFKNQAHLAPGADSSSGRFDEESFQYVLSQWKTRQERIEEIDQRYYPDIFAKKTGSPQNETSSSSDIPSGVSSSSSLSGFSSNQTSTASSSETADATTTATSTNTGTSTSAASGI